MVDPLKVRFVATFLTCMFLLKTYAFFTNNDAHDDTSSSSSFSKHPNMKNVMMNMEHGTIAKKNIRASYTPEQVQHIRDGNEAMHMKEASPLTYDNPWAHYGGNP